MTFSLSCISQETKRIILKKINISHLDAFHAYSLQEKIYTHLEFPPFKEIADTEKYINKLKLRISSGKADYRFLFLKNTNTLVGLFGFHSYDDYRRSVEFGYGVSPSYQGRGIFTEVGSHIIYSLFKKTNIQRIFALTSVDNIPSIKSISKLGFQKEGILKDYYLKDKVFYNAYLAAIVRSNIK